MAATCWRNVGDGFANKCGGNQRDTRSSIRMTPGVILIHDLVSSSLTAYFVDPGGQQSIVRELSLAANYCGGLCAASPKVTNTTYLRHMGRPVIGGLFTHT